MAARSPRESRPLARPVILALAVPVPIVIASLFLGRACDSHQPAHSLGHAAWIETADGPRIGVVEHLNRSGDDGPSYIVHRIAGIDARTGATLPVWMLPDTGDMESTVLWATRGPWVWLVSGDAWHPSWSVARWGEEPVGIDSLEDRFPQVMAPWAAALVGVDGVLRVESDDKRQWEIDLAAATATEHPGLYLSGSGWSGAQNAGCLATYWRGETSYALVERVAARHSQIDNFFLVKADIDEYGGVTAREDVAGGFARPSFLCDGNGHVATAAGDALVVEYAPGMRISRISRSGERVWSWTPPEGEGTLEAWTGPDTGAIVRVDRTFYGLDAKGAERWRTER